MISSLRGTFLQKTGDKLIVEVGGVGYGVFCPAGGAQLPALGEEIFIHTYLHVREDSLDLFGFMALEEKEMFITLLSVSGVGPKVALNILAASRPAELAAAIRADDIARLVKLPGIGKKTAERLCLELKDKVQALVETTESDAGGSLPISGGIDEDVLSALVNLGYQHGEAATVVRRLAKQFASEGVEPHFDEFVRLALRMLA